MANIFIVEDEMDICETYTDILEAAGHSVKSTDRASRAYPSLISARPDVVILDMHLPGASGMFVAAFIRRYSQLAHTKIIIISGYPEMARQAVQDYRADLFLEKPVSPDQLRTTINSLASPPMR